MKDYRAIIAGALATVCVVLAAFQSDAERFAQLLGLAGTLASFVIGLYSSPQGGDE